MGPSTLLSAFCLNWHKIHCQMPTFFSEFIFYRFQITVFNKFLSSFSFCKYKTIERKQLGGGEVGWVGGSGSFALYTVCLKSKC